MTTHPKRGRVAMVYNDYRYRQLLSNFYSDRILMLHSSINAGVKSWDRMYWGTTHYSALLVIDDMKPGVLAWRI